MTPTPTIVIMTEEEVSRCVPADDEPGFGALTTARGPLPLKALDVQARLDGLLAETTVRQTFVNTHAEPLEATYIFPLPDRAAVTQFRMEVAGRVVEGVLKERGEARRTYDRAIQAGHRAAITEEERPGVFTLRVGNLMPGESATVHLSLSGPLIYDSGEVTFRFPLVVAPRYIPGSPLSGPSVGSGVASDTDAVPDASRISPPVLLPGYPNPVRLSLSVDIESSALAPRDFRCSLHSAIVEEEGRVARIRLEPGERLDRDFILRFRVGDENLRSSLALLPDKPGAREGTFALTLLPPAMQGRSAKPRDVVFVLDRSGSMGGWKMVAARRALGRMVDTLTERDGFAVYAFDDRVETVPEFRGPGLATASDRNRFRAVEFLAKIEARGGTEMAHPLDLAVQQLEQASRGRQPPEAPQRDHILVLITDGQVGNEDQILRLLGKRLAGLRIFTLGIDQAVNEGFLKRLATLGGGFCEVVESEDRLDEVMKRLHSRIGTPLLTGLKLEEAGFRIEAERTVPSRLPDLFAGAALLVLGRYQGVPEGSFFLSGQDAAGRRWCEAVSSRLACNPAVGKAWARAYVRELEDRFVTGQGDARQLERQIVEVSLKFGVLCRFTSYVAVDRTEVVNEGGDGHRIVQPVEMPAGWEMQTVVRGAFTGVTRTVQIPIQRGGQPPAPLGTPAYTLGAAVPPPAAALPPESVDSFLMQLDEDEQPRGLVQRAEAEDQGSEKDILETDFEVPPLEEDSGSEAIAMEDADTGLDSSVSELTLDEADGDFADQGDSEVVALDEEEGQPARRPRKPSPPPPLPTVPPSENVQRECLRSRDRRVIKSRSVAPPANQAKEKAPGLLGKVFGLFKKNKGTKERAAPNSTPFDLSAYRRRAAELLEPIRAGSGLTGQRRFLELGLLAVQLKALLEDLASVGAPPLELQPLQKLHAGLTALLEQPSPDEAAVARLWAQAEEVLRVFAGVPVEAPVAGRREGFWK
jgi:Ca-activated chloride channel family protein